MLAEKRVEQFRLRCRTITVKVTSAGLSWMLLRQRRLVVRQFHVRLDDLVPDAAVGLIKIDVEGYELQVLEGSSNILKRSRPLLYVENDRVSQSPQLIQWLFDHGYELWWHIPPLFNTANFRGIEENVYSNIRSFNMLCVPGPNNLVIEGLARIVDPFFHPLEPRPICPA
jgi:hypothetical protein